MIISGLIIDRKHRLLLLEKGRGPRRQWFIPQVETAATERPLQAFEQGIERLLGLALPQPIGSYVPDDGHSPRDFVFLLAPEQERTLLTLSPEVLATEWVPLAAAWQRLAQAGLADQAWKLYCEAMLGGFEPAQRNLDAFHFGATPDSAARLAHLVVKGVKRATSGFIEVMRRDGDTIPYVGLRSLVTDYYGIPQCLITTTEVRVVPFGTVAADVARGEGEGDLTLADWREGHIAFFAREAKEAGLAFDDTTMVFNEFFRVDRVLGPSTQALRNEGAAAIAADRQLTAYNAGDIDGFVACYHPEVTVFDLATGLSKMHGTAEMREKYGAMFRTFPNQHAELLGRVGGAHAIVDFESVYGRVPGDGPSRVLAIYEAREGLISRVWFLKADG